MMQFKFSLKSIQALFVLILVSCNPVSEDVNGALWNSLHNAKPHNSSYFHSAGYRFPNGACSEVQCHGSTLAGGNSGAPSCFSCHDDQWTIFGVSHTKKISGYYHRYNVDDYSSQTSSNSNWYSDCKTCHGSTLAGVTGGPSANFAYRYSCMECHTGFSGSIPPPGHSVKKSEDGATGWHHYNIGSSNPESNNTYCSGLACHDTTGRGTRPASGLFGRSPACGECH